MNAAYMPVIDSAACAAAFRAACEMDVLAFKPGNVSLESAGHGMSARDFLISAEVAAPCIADPMLGLGERIYRAIEATRLSVGCNTNLGIVLLAAPLIHAAQQRRPDEGLADALDRSLDGFDLEQTTWAFRAIRLAAPGGLGRSQRHDVHDTAKAPLRMAMREASRRDCIARQYANGYADILGSGRAALAEARQRWGEDAPAMSTLFISYLADYPDSHVQRKHGAAAAEGVRQMARQCQKEVRLCGDWQQARKPLEELDRTLKSAGINPGTSADLSVATWLLDPLLDLETASSFSPTETGAQHV